MQAAFTAHLVLGIQLFSGQEAYYLHLSSIASRMQCSEHISSVHLCFLWCNSTVAQLLCSHMCLQIIQFPRRLYLRLYLRLQELNNIGPAVQTCDFKCRAVALQTTYSLNVLYQHHGYACATESVACRSAAHSVRYCTTSSLPAALAA